MDASGPVEITPPGVNRAPVLTYRYANGVLLQVAGGHLNPRTLFVPKGWDVRTRMTNFGALFAGENGWIQVGRGGHLKCFPPKILEQVRVLRGARHAVNNHHQNWFDCIRTRERPVCDVAIGARSTIVSHLGCIAHWTGRSLKWDPAKEVFAGDDEANRWRARPMRSPWRL